MPQLVNLEQGSPDWLKWREGGIGASDVPIVMEESPWSTAYQLWCLKTKRVKPKPPTKFQQHGTNSEEFLRQWYVGQVGVEMQPTTAIYDDAEFIRASVDGWNAGLRKGMELKCPATAASFRRAKEGHIPWFYLLQMYAEMEVLDAAAWDYVCGWVVKGKVVDAVTIPVERDSDRWAIEILPRLVEFWDRVQNDYWPKPDGEVFEESQEWREAAQAWFIAESTIAECEDMRLRAVAALRRMSTAKYTMGAGVRTRYEQWRPRYEIKLTADTQENAARIMQLIESNKDIMPLVRRDKDGSKVWRTDYPPNLILKIEANQ